MSDVDYDYRGMKVQYWDLLRGDTSRWSSRPYFLQLIRESGEPALDEDTNYIVLGKRARPQ